MDRRKLLIWGVGLVITLAVMVIAQWPDGNVYVYGCSVGQGDAMVVTHGFDQILIDGGPKNGQVLACLDRAMPFWDRQIELLVVSHPQADHIGGLTQVLTRYHVPTVLVPNTAEDTQLFKEFYRAVRNEQAKVVTADLGQQLQLGDLKIKVLWPDWQPGMALVWNKEADVNQVLGMVSGEGGSDVNESSTVVEIDFHDFNALFTGDSTEAVEGQYLNELGNQIFEVVKVPHHGSKTSSSQGLVDKVRAQAALIEVGAKNRYNHPTESVVKRWGDSGAKVWRTDKQGTIIFSSNGEDGVLNIDSDK